MDLLCLVRKFFKSFFIAIAAVISIFSIFQIPSLQKKLINYAFSDAARVDFTKTKGIFPFKFSINGLKISNKEFVSEIDGINLEMSKSMICVKKLDVGNVVINMTNPTKISLSDLKYASPVFIQKIFKNVALKQLNVQGEILKNISFTYDKKTGIRNINLLSKLGELNCRWKFDNDRIFCNTTFANVSAKIVYEITNRHVNVIADYKSNNIIFDGIYDGDNSLVGALSPSFLKDTKLTGKISVKDDSLEIQTRADSLGISGELKYELNSNFIECGNFVFDNGIVIKPFAINADLTIPALTFLLKKGKIDFKNINLSENNFSLGNVAFLGVDVSQFAGSDVGGTLNGSGTYSCGVEKLKLKLSDFSINSIKIPEIFIDAAYSKNETTLKLAFDFLKKKNRIDAKIQNYNWLISKNSRISLEASGKFNIEDYKLPDNQIANGKIIYKLDINGTIEKPIVSGNINLKKGYYINQSSGTYIRDVTLNCVVKNNNASINKIYARDDSKNPGSIEGKGNIAITNDNAEANASIKINNLKIAEQNWLDARLFGELTLKGDLSKGVKISGLLYTNNPKIDISNFVILSSRAVDLLDAPLAKTQLDDNANFPFKCFLDILLEIRPELKIVGMGIDSSWTGGGKAHGDISNVKYEVKTTLKKGRINVQDNALKLKNGEILLDNENTNIDVSAEKRLDGNATVGAKFTQYNGISSVEFYSSPYLPKNDILSYILFDKKSSETSTSEALVLFSIINKATGTNGFDIINKMKTVFGIDSLGIKKNNDPVNGEYNAVSIGKKIGKIKLSVDQGAAKDTTNVVAETKIAENTKLSVDLSRRDAFGAGVLWSKRY
ncbi:MAG: translocation/assembly module TamB [Holosporales bacterium]|nr:translocation/assembly module TamB [Holosporales bacterium]